LVAELLKPLELGLDELICLKASFIELGLELQLDALALLAQFSNVPGN